MPGKIALEEHFGVPGSELLDRTEEVLTPAARHAMQTRLTDLIGDRLRLMDAADIEHSVLSLMAPGIQALTEPAHAITAARWHNDYIADAIADHRDRFSAFAVLPLQDPDAAATELQRAVTELGCVGALVNGYSQISTAESAHYYDQPEYWPFWSVVEQLGVPVYLHPRNPLPSRQQIYRDHPWLLSAAWAFSVETGTHALRLMGSGLFDTYPGLNVILGHLGELVPFNIWRIDHRISIAPRGIRAKQPFRTYLRNNFYLTTSGNFDHTALAHVLDVVGAERILFATDYPFEAMSEAAEWFDTLPLDQTTRTAIATTNARALLRL